jgi:hypothetical protein
MMRFLGGLPLALVLIGLAAVLVIAGTFIEANASSHSLADKWIYKSPLFQLLLIGFFINILTSALMRYPFKRRHIPFLLTHLGLLMVIAGVFIKQQWGVQGSIELMEGTSSKNLVLPGTQALIVDYRNGKTARYPLDKPLPPPFKKIAILPHAKETYHSWIEGDFIHLLGQKPMKLPVDQIVNLEGNTYRLMAKDSQPSFEVIYGGKPYIYFEKQSEAILIHSGDGFGNNRTQSINPSFPTAYAMYDRGFQGYTALATLSMKDQASLELESPLKRQVSILKPSHKLEENCPCLAIQIAGEGETLLVWKSPFKASVDSKQKLISFGEEVYPLPFEIRLHQARDIKYPGTEITESYECDLTLIAENGGQRCTLSMNQVHETQEGYRLYLSGMGFADALGVRNVHIVINRDPAKYLLTYPGGLLIACGIIGLFFISKRK